MAQQLCWAERHHSYFPPALNVLRHASASVHDREAAAARFRVRTVGRWAPRRMCLVLSM